MAIKSFADTSAVSLAYAFSDAAKDSELSASLEMTYIPFTTEGFSMGKDAQESTAITSNRRSKGSKNTKGNAEGAATIEFGAAEFCKDFLAAALMSDWDNDVITDGETKKYMFVEKVTRPSVGESEKQYLEKYFGTLVNDASLNMSDGEVITLEMNTMSAFADYDEATQGSDGLGGSSADAKNSPADYEIADSSNNLKTVEIKSGNSTLETTFSDLTLSINNNARTQGGVGHVFAAGMAVGKVEVQLTGTAYYYDQSVLKAHMDNDNLSASFNIEVEEGTFEVNIPNMTAESPDANAQGENQDYTQDITLTAHEGEYDGKKCCIHVKFVEA